MLNICFSKPLSHIMACCLFKANCLNHTGPLGTYFSEICNQNSYTFLFKKMPLIMLSSSQQPFCLRLNVLRARMSFWKTLLRQRGLLAHMAHLRIPWRRVPVVLVASGQWAEPRPCTVKMRLSCCRDACHPQCSDEWSGCVSWQCEKSHIRVLSTYENEPIKNKEIVG